MNEHATPEDCPCCHNPAFPRSPDDLDSMLIVAFLGGIAAHADSIPIGAALCAKHAELAAGCVAFVNGLASVVDGGGTS